MFKREILYVFAISIAVATTPFTTAHADFLSKAKAAYKQAKSVNLNPDTVVSRNTGKSDDTPHQAPIPTEIVSMELRGTGMFQTRNQVDTPVTNAKGKKAWIYQHRRNGTFVYCDSPQGSPRDFRFVGTMTHPNPDTCFLVQ